MFDGCPSFSGGQVSFQRANILQPNQASLIENFNIAINGELQKRRGSRPLGPAYVAAQGFRVQGMLFYDTVLDSKLIAFAEGKAKSFDVDKWVNLFATNIADTNELISCVQLTDDIFWTDSNEGAIRMWDGTTVSTVTGSPSATMLTVHGTRLVASGLTDVPDAIDFSDLLNGKTWNLVNQRLRIGNGDGDPIIGHISWQDTGILAFKRQSVWLIDASPLTEVAAFPIKLVHSSIGCVARHTICQVGQDIWFLSSSGVQSVQKQLATSNNQITVPVSQAVQDVIQRIHWDYAYKSTAIFHNNRYLLSVPVESNEPDTVLVFNVLTGGWSVITGWQACSFISQPFEGTTRLIYGTHEGRVKVWLDHERTDGADSFKEIDRYLTLPFELPQDFPSTSDFDATLTTRAMTFAEPLNPKTGFYLELEFVTNDMDIEIYAILDGAPRTLLESIENITPQISLPIDLPFDFPEAAGWARKRIPLHQLPPFREIQFQIICPRGKLALREISASGFVDTLELRRN